MRYIPFTNMRGNLGGLTPPLPIDTGSNMVIYYDFQNVNSYPTSGSVAYNLITNSAWTGQTLNLYRTSVGGFPLLTGYTNNNFGEISYSGPSQYGFAFFAAGGDSFDGWSIGGWFKNTSDSGVLFSRGGGFATSPGYSMALSKGADNRLALGIVNSRNKNNVVGTYGSTVWGSTVLELDRWYYVIGIWQKGNNGRIFLNGNLEAMSKSTNTSLFGGSSFGQAALQFSSGVTEFYSGSFGDYEIYASSVSQSLVLNNFSAKTGSYGVTYTANNNIPINPQLTVTNQNTGSLRIYVDRGSGFGLEYTLTNSNPTTLTTENTIYGQPLVINAGNSFYATLDDRQYVANDKAYINIYKNLTNVESVSAVSVTSSVFNATTNDAFTLETRSGTGLGYTPGY